MIMRAGVLSDTHIRVADAAFCKRVAQIFAGCDVIIHAGDLTESGILTAFTGKTVYAVHGNCCSAVTRATLSERLLFKLGNFTIGLAHGNGRKNIEDSLWMDFPEADCIVYGHTHRAVCHRKGDKLFLNPGSFQSGSYAILEAGETLSARLFQIG